ncbi:MAG: sulfotransferase [Alphaproteobacteria bacterium]|nr:sulfotransferase [Alphaproteobacteria bacterium]
MTATRKKVSPLDAALALQQTGDLDGAEAGFRAVLEQDPENPDALVLLGDLLRRTGKASEGAGLIARAIESAPGQGRRPDPSWRVALAYAKRDAGDVGGALKEIETLLKLAPTAPELTFLRAELLQRLKRHEEAVADYEAHLRQKPGNAKALNNMGVSLKAVDRLKDAYEAFRKALELRPNYTQAMVNVGKMLGDMGQMEAAIAQLRRAVAYDPDDRKAENALVHALQLGDRAEEAERLAERIYERDPDAVQSMIQLGNVRMVMGNRADAVALARKAHAMEPRAQGGLSLLAEADGEAAPAELLGEIEGILARGQDFRHRIGLHFSAAKLCEKIKRYEEAFAHYVEGNAARKDQLQRMEKFYDPSSVERRVEELIENFDRERCAGPAGSSSELPVLIVGMPRSGTSLTEQILASHPRVAGAGELREIGLILDWLTRDHDYPLALPQDALKEAATGYLRYVGKIGRGAARVTDKMPGNFMNLGLITRMFPKARIIHCRRDPMDNCLSCFAQNFSADGLIWSTDLVDLGHQYCQYRRMMVHWRAVLPRGRMLEIDYEDTVADLETQARRLVEFVGLEWDDACLEFHKTERAVATASREQVRNPIYKSSVGRWRRYGDGVLPLADALAACGCEPAVDRGEAST